MKRQHARREYAPDDQSRGARISRGLRRFHHVRLEAARMTPRDLLALAAPGSTVRYELRPLMAAGAGESVALLEAMGCAQHVSPQVRIACEDFGRLGAVLRGLVQRWGETGDPEIASRVASVASARRGLLALIGLERVARDVPKLGDYLRTRSAGAGRASGGACDVEPAPVVDLAAGEDAEAEA